MNLISVNKELRKFHISAPFQPVIKDNPLHQPQIRDFFIKKQEEKLAQYKKNLYFCSIINRRSLLQHFVDFSDNGKARHKSFLIMENIVKKITFRPTPQMANELSEMAINLGTTRSSLIRTALLKFLNDYETTSQPQQQ